MGIAAATTSREEIEALVRQLVQIDSVNPGLIAGAAGEQAVADFVAEWLQQRGLEVQVEAVAPGRPNVLGTVRGSGGGRSLMLYAHTDTVGPGDMPAPFAPRVEGDRLYGLGAYDMKGGLAAAMLAGARLAADPPAGDVTIVAVADEEHASIGCEALVARHRADAAILVEPTELQTCVAHKGFVWLELAVRGRAAHGSDPAAGIDAIAKTGKLLVALEQLGARLAQDPAHPRLGSGSVHASLISGGQELSSYPAHCSLQLERRTVPGETEEHVLAELRELVRAAQAQDAAVDCEVSVLLAREPFEIGPEEPVVASVQRGAQAVTSATPALVGGSGWMDAALFAGAGIPAVVFGPAGANAHAVDEWLDLPSTGVCVDVLVAAARDFCG